VKLPPTWRLAQLGEAVQIENVGVIPEAGERYRYVGLENIEQHTGDLIAPPQVDGGDIRSLKYRFDRSHILYGKLRPNLNKVALPDFAGICSTDILPLAVRNPAVREYVAFYLRSPDFVHLATTQASGTKMPRFGPELLLNARIPLPPVLVQRRIVSILTKADGIRRKRAEARAIADAIGPSLFRYYFGDASAHRRRWPVRAIGDFEIDTRYGTSTRTELHPPGDPVLRIPNVIREHIDTSELKYLQVAREERERLLLRKGDLLIVRTNGNKDYAGRCAVFDLDGDWLFASYLIRVRFPTSGLHPDYLAAYLRTAGGRREIDHLTRTSAGQYNLSAEGLRAIRLMVPPYELQEEFANRIRSARELGYRLASVQDDSGGVSSSLVAHAFGGELTAEWEQANAEEISAHQRLHVHHAEAPRVHPEYASPRLSS
jgi:type I restriction enzyme S subunit